MKNNTYWLLLFCMAMVIMSSECHKTKPYEQAFKIPVDIYPLKKNYSLTDTIWLETDIQGKQLFDTRTNQFLSADTGNITFGGVFAEFGFYISNPSDGFCDVITKNGLNIDRSLSEFRTHCFLDNIGCGDSSYRCKIGFKPNHTGIYSLELNYIEWMRSCPEKIIPYYSSIDYQYKNVDLNLDILNSVSDRDLGGKDNRSVIRDRVINRSLFLFKVE